MIAAIDRAVATSSTSVFGIEASSGVVMFCATNSSSTWLRVSMPW